MRGCTGSVQHRSDPGNNAAVRVILRTATPLEPLCLSGCRAVDMIQQQQVVRAKAWKMLGVSKPYDMDNEKCTVHFAKFLPSLKYFLVLFFRKIPQFLPSVFIFDK